MSDLTERAKDLIPDESDWEGFNVIQEMIDRIEELEAQVRTSETYPGFKRPETESMAWRLPDAVLDSFYDDPSFMEDQTNG
ncbi:MAG: hypothetical protein GY708_12985 [Actinomycetia bacterium]|nr:hypothetical protein [Actinomycetes bacterium]